MKHGLLCYFWWGLMPNWVHKLSLKRAMIKIKNQILKERSDQIDKIIKKHINKY